MSFIEVNVHICEDALLHRVSELLSTFRFTFSSLLDDGPPKEVDPQPVAVTTVPAKSDDV